MGPLQQQPTHRACTDGIRRAMTEQAAERLEQRDGAAYDAAYEAACDATCDAAYDAAYDAFINELTRGDAELTEEMWKDGILMEEEQERLVRWLRLGSDCSYSR